MLARQLSPVCACGRRKRRGANRCLVCAALRIGPANLSPETRAWLTNQLLNRS